MSYSEFLKIFDLTGKLPWLYAKQMPLERTVIYYSWSKIRLAWIYLTLFTHTPRENFSFILEFFCQAGGNILNFNSEVDNR